MIASLLGHQNTITGRKEANYGRKHLPKIRVCADALREGRAGAKMVLETRPRLRILRLLFLLQNGNDGGDIHDAEDDDRKLHRSRFFCPSLIKD